MKFYLKKRAHVDTKCVSVSDILYTKTEAETFIQNHKLGVKDDVIWHLMTAHFGDEGFYDFWLCDTETHEEICCLYSSDGANT